MTSLTSHSPFMRGTIVAMSYPPTLANVWQALADGDEEAFRQVFNDHHKAVYNFAFRHTGSWSAAEEATQTCFVNVWRKAKEGSLPRLDDSAIRAWLCGFVRNECRNLERSSRRHLRLVKSVEPQTSADNVSTWVDDESSMQRINAVMAKIPDQQRAVVELVVWSGLGMAETAAALKVPVGTVKSRLARARNTLATTEVAHLLGQENLR